MRTFHIGGTAQVVDQSTLESSFEGKIEIRNRNIVKDSEGRNIAMARNMQIVIVDRDGTERASNRVTFGSKMLVEEGDKVKRGQRMAEWDPYTRPIISEVDGVVAFEDLVDRLSVSEADRRVDRHHQARGHRLAGKSAQQRPEADDPGQGQGRQVAEERPRWRGSALPAAGRDDPVGRARSRGQGRRRARAYPDGKRQDARHHRRSAAGGGAVRGAASEGPRDHRRDPAARFASAAITRTSAASSSIRWRMVRSRSST